MPLSNGTSLGHYEIHSLLGAGGMGEVYLAHDARLNRKVALKVLPADLINNRERLRRFEQEARAASALNHPNIITIHEIGSCGATHFIAMEFIEGETLRRRLQMPHLEIEETLHIATQIAAALEAAHRSGIVHRDIKPENVMLRADGVVKVLDFGLAKLTETKGDIAVDTEAPTRAQEVQTTPGVIMGTVAYMSPEQARGQEVDARTDIFSLGVVLYEMLAGRLPFAGGTMSDVLAALLTTEPASLISINQAVPAELERIVGKTLSKDREERYQTAKDLLVDLNRLKKQLEIQTEIERAASAGKTENAYATQIIAARPTSITAYVAVEIRKHKLGFAVALSVLLFAAIGSGYRFLFNPSSNTKQIESIAVMPFVNESGNSDVEYLSDGMTETLIGSLSQLPKLNVKARSSVFHYKGKETDAQTIGKELNVQAILNGRIVQRGDNLTLYLSLVDAQTGNQIWGESHNRKMTDLVSLQSEIARDVSSKLKIKLSGADEQKLAKNYTENTEAYQLYLKGRFYWNKRTGESLRKAVEFYKQAIEKDPNYARAYAGLAESYAIFSVFNVASLQDSMPQAKAAALKALELDDSVPEAHAALGIYESLYAWNQLAAEKELRRAIELNPNYATAHQWLGNVPLLPMKRFDEAIAAGRRAEELDPLSPVIVADVGCNLYYARRYDEAIAQFKRARALDPNFYYTRYNLALAYHAKKMYTEAIAEFRKALELEDDPAVKAMLVRWQARDDARRRLNYSNKSKPSPNIAMCRAILWRIFTPHWATKTKRLSGWRKDIAEHSTNTPYHDIEPLLDPLRDDPRFQGLLRKVGFPP